MNVVLFAACSGGNSEFKNPHSFADNTCNHFQELRVKHVEFTDTATIITFYYKSKQPFYRISIGPQTYLSDGADRHYKALYMTKHKLGDYFFSLPWGMTFKVGFEPMPKETRIFDIIGGLSSNCSKIYGIHNAEYTVSKPEYSSSELLEAERIRSTIFETGSVTVRGHIEEYDRNQGQTIRLNYSDYMAGKDNTFALDIDSDGHFELSFDVHSFMGGALVDHNQNWHEFIAQPGDTLEMTIYPDGSHSISLSGGRQYLLADFDRIDGGVNVIDEYRFMRSKLTKIDRIQDYASECRERGRHYTAYIASKYHLSAFEYQYANIMMENDVLKYYLTRRTDISRYRSLLKIGNKLIHYDEYLRLKEKQNKEMCPPETWELIAGFTANDSLMMVMPAQWMIFNYYKFDPAFDAGDVSLDSLEGRFNNTSLYFLESSLTDSVHLANDMRLFGAQEPSLMGKICVMQDMESHLNNLNKYADQEGLDADSVLAAYMCRMKTLLNDANLSARADVIYQDFIRSQAPYWDLPECRGREVLQSILANYPGKYVYLDFWSTSCGPCIADIKYCYNNRREVMTGKHDKFAMVFITYDRESAYEPFRQKWLEGAESYRLSPDDYNALAGMFNFWSIPHHEMITPDGRAVTKVPEMYAVNPDSPI